MSSQNKVLMPDSYLHEFIKSLHINLGHIGMKKRFKSINEGS